MLDQAYDLRRLAVRRERPTSDARPATLAVVGGKGGVGTTTVALNLAAAVAQTGTRTVLVDADPRGGDAAMLCGIEEQFTLADAIVGRQTWKQVGYPGPSGVRLVAGCRAWHERGGSPAAAVELLFEQLDEQTADLVVIDAGNARGEIVPHVGRLSDAVVVVTTADAASVVGAFATIKAIVTGMGHEQDGKSAFRPYLLVNQAASDREAETVHDRIAHACRRLLGVELQPAGLRVMAERIRKNRAQNQTGLNFRTLFVDKVRVALVAEMLLNWRRQAKFNVRQPSQSP